MHNFIDIIKYLGNLPHLSSRSISDTVAIGLGGGAVTNIIASLPDFVLCVAADAPSAIKLKEDLQKYGKNAEIISFREEVLFYSRAYSKEGALSRLEALYKIVSGKAQAAIITAESLLRIFPPVKAFTEAIIKIEKDKDYDLAQLTKKLTEAGYKRESVVEGRGQFALRGDIFDIFPVNDNALRIDFFGTKAEEIKYFDTESGKSYARASVVEIAPATDVFFEQSETAQIIQKINEAQNSSGLKGKHLQKLQEICADIISRLSEGYKSLHYVMPLISGQRGIRQYLPGGSAVVFLDSKLITDRLGVAYKEHITRYTALLSYGEVLPFAKEQYISAEEAVEQFKDIPRITFNALNADTFYNAAALNVKTSAVPKYSINFESLKTDIRNWLYGGYKVYICCKDEQGAKELEDNLNNNRETLVTAFPDDGGQFAQLLHLEITEGFVSHQNKFVLIGYNDIFVRKKAKSIKKRKKDVFFSPDIGDYIVHDVHGIGICRGIKNLKAGNISKDYIVLEYSGGDTLYVPCDQMDSIAKYSGVDNKPRLNKLGGREFEKIKQRIKNQIKKMAFDLKELYAQRENRKGYAFNKDSPLQKEFEDAFEFEETEDQLASIAEIKKDMESPQIMDRLLCGDVGYGKTEVALRAAFKAVVDGKQVALLAPTTILSQQHYNLCLKRLGQYGVRLDVLNRFKSRKEQKEIIEKIRLKQIDLIIGTHRLLSSDIVFNDLGLLIVDEEQRFGVEHKERIKNINKSVDVLSLSATPIPRTLHMSLTGIRDISIIDTPPSERLPVQTYVVEYSEGIVYDAVSRELARGGQVFILYNRTESIESFALKISQIVPYAKIITAHGQMREEALENAVETFYNGNADVLICTTIIENGIDIANVNTLIVYEADRLGLSQLYQLRGRVGRGNRLAHVYFTYLPQKILTENAYKRLKAIMEYTEFGSGFKIAIRDLEIRGAGSVLGARQHGHIENVGYDMYLKLLRQSISDDDGQEEQIDFDIAADAYIPEKYIEENAHRMKVYQRIAATDFEEKDELIRELADIYGEVPQAVINLINIRLLKIAAKGSGVQAVTIKANKAEITLGGVEKLQNNRLLDAVEQYSDICSLKFTDKAQIVFNIKKADSRKTLEILIDFFKKTKSEGKI